MSLSEPTNSPPPASALLGETLAERGEPGNLGGAGDLRTRQQAAVLAFGRRTSARPSISVLFQDAVALVSEVLHAELAGTSEVQAGGTLLRRRLFEVGSRGRIGEQLLREAALESDNSLPGYALHVASPVVSARVATDKRFADLFLRELKVQSALAVPLPVGDKPFGTLEVYFRRSQELSVDDVHFVETISHLLAASAARGIAEEQLQRRESLAAAVLESLAELILVIDAEGHLLHVNRLVREATGLSEDELQSRLAWMRLIPAGETEPLHVALQGVFARRTREELDGAIVLRGGGRQPIRWSLRPLADTGKGGDAANVCAALLRGTPRVEVAPAPAGGRKGQPPAAPTAPLPNPNLRTSPRLNYHYRQSIAPIRGERLPGRQDFFEVACQDISASGISFYLGAPPDFQTLVVALGRAPGLSYFTAQVVRIADQQQGSGILYLVGCRFTGRVELP